MYNAPPVLNYGVVGSKRGTEVFFWLILYFKQCSEWAAPKRWLKYTTDKNFTLTLNLIKALRFLGAKRARFCPF